MSHRNPSSCVCARACVCEAEMSHGPSHQDQPQHGSSTRHSSRTQPWEARGEAIYERCGRILGPRRTLKGSMLYCSTFSYGACCWCCANIIEPALNCSVGSCGDAVVPSIGRACRAPCGRVLVECEGSGSAAAHTSPTLIPRELSDVIALSDAVRVTYSSYVNSRSAQSTVRESGLTGKQ